MVKSCKVHSPPRRWTTCSKPMEWRPVSLCSQPFTEFAWTSSHRWISSIAFAATPSTCKRPTDDSQFYEHSSRFFFFLLTMVSCIDWSIMFEIFNSQRVQRHGNVYISVYKFVSHYSGPVFICKLDYARTLVTLSGMFCSKCQTHNYCRCVHLFLYNTARLQSYVMNIWMRGILFS